MRFPTPAAALVVCTEYYVPRDPVRRAEIEQCLRTNASLDWWSELVLFCEREEQLPAVLGRAPQARALGRRFVFSDFLDLARDPSRVYVLMNADITLGGGCKNFFHVRPGELWALSRWDQGASPGFLGRESQDVWALRGGSFPEAVRSRCGFSLGVPGCDNAFAGLFHEAGWRVINPCLDVRTDHHHASGMRAYGEAERVPRPYFFPTPSRLPLGVRFRAALARLNR